MNLLKFPKKKAQQRFIGAFVPLETNNLLILYSLAKDENKSLLIRRALSRWVAANVPSTSELIEEIITRARQVWKIEKTVNPGATLFEYKQKLHQELESKGLEGAYIYKILNGIE